jgi:hypothetical protein
MVTVVMVLLCEVLMFWLHLLASGFRLAVSRLDRLDTKSAFDLEE